MGQVKAKNVPKFLFSFGIIFGVIGGVLLWASVSSWLKSRGSDAWPSVKGRVSVSDVFVGKKTMDPEAFRARDRNDDDEAPYFGANIVYTYEVKGVEYKGSRIGFTHNYTQYPDPALKVVDEYPIDTEVTVYYKPENPKEAVLVPGVDMIVYIMGSISLVILAFVVVVFYKGEKARRELKKS